MPRPLLERILHRFGTGNVQATVYSHGLLALLLCDRCIIYQQRHQPTHHGSGQKRLLNTTLLLLLLLLLVVTMPTTVTMRGES